MSEASRFRPPAGQVKEPVERQRTPKVTRIKPVGRDTGDGLDDSSASQLEFGRGAESWFFLKSSIWFLGGSILCLVAAMVLLFLTGSRGKLDLPWADTAIDTLGFGTVALALVHLLLKALALLTDRHGTRRRPPDRRRQ